MKVFLSFHFVEEATRPSGEISNRALMQFARQLIESHGIEVITGERLGGGPLRPEVQRLIEDADALVALCTADVELAAGGYHCSEWVRGELDHARREVEIHSIALLETGVDLGGMFKDHEIIPLDRRAPLEALLALSQTLARWKTVALKVEVLPPELRELAADPEDELTCQYRLCDQGKFTDWQPVRLIPEREGTFAYIKAASTGQGIQFMLRHRGELWTSPVTPQRMRVELEKVRRESRVARPEMR
jgi:hypothetical protein